ncbi:MAG TPA: DUF4388 domain-containing protein [Polyangiaceae bacterium]|nr:DUF4388 domain-containing protein [Polyangiaceae bacterium]
MTRTVLVIEADVDVLGSVASSLRARGLDVWIADGLERALERARSGLPHALVLSYALARSPTLDADLGRVPGLGSVPRFVLSEARASGDTVDGSEIAALVQRIVTLPGARAAQAGESTDFRGDLSQISFPDLVQLLSINRQSGTLSIQTPLGPGEVRLVEGEPVDASYRRLEGAKALFRLLGEREGTFSFASGATMPLVRRIEWSASWLLLEGMRQLDEVDRLEAALGLGDDALIAAAPSSPDATDLEQNLLQILAVPRTLAELLDETPALDLDALRVVTELLERGSVRRITGGALRADLADPERAGVLSALVKRLERAGFRGPARVGIAAPSRRLLGVLSALGRLAEAMLPSESVPAAPIPHVLATLRLADGVDLEIVGIPLVEAYAPVWALVLPGCIGVARLSPSETLVRACELSGVPCYELSLGERSDDDPAPERVAALVCDLVERAAGERG